MTRTRSAESLVGLVRELLKLPKETEWIEFKVNNDSPQEIGEYLSALANSAALEEKAFAYLLWGVEDGTRRVVGTGFSPKDAKMGNEELENWLLRLLSPRIDFRFFEVTLAEGRVVLVEVSRAFPHPVKFNGEEYVRVGSYKKKLKDYPEKERALWRLLDKTPFEKGIAAEQVAEDEVSELLDVSSYFRLIGAKEPGNRAAILDILASEELIRRGASGGWDVTNLGAILFAQSLRRFGRLKRKAMRVIAYRGKGRLEAQREQEGDRGYATGFEGLIGFVNGLMPTNEVIAQALRKTVPMYPELAVRELVANAIIHQDFAVTGAGPMVEIFDGRMEVTNPGTPLVPIDRFVDHAPRSRNEGLASLMRRVGVCEERGSGIDKVVAQTELHQLPAPLFQAEDEFMRATLYAHRSFQEMDKQERVRACYLHACLRWVQGEHLTNNSVRERFGLPETQGATASRLIRDAVTAGLLVLRDPDTSRRLMEYLPYWAASRPSGQDL
ncbi:MAG: ATP-binding protein [Polyangiaceae bacterium]